MQYLFKELFFEKVKEFGGKMAVCHAHIDRAFTLTKELWGQASALMEEKWILNRNIKMSEGHSKENLKKRFEFMIDLFKKQGVTACRTHVDADSIVGLKCVEVGAEVRDKHKDDFTLQLVPQPLEGFLTESKDRVDKEKVEIYEKACEICDVVGGLPSRDRAMPGGDEKHLEILISIAKNLGKDIDMHTDQENNPLEKDTEFFADTCLKNGMYGRITFIHSISLACQMEEDRKRVYGKLKELGANISVCPKAAVGMKQHIDKVAPVHNSIAPVEELLKEGINVSLGVDNVSDLFIPNSIGDVWDEIDLLADACRIYDLDTLAKIVTENGRKTMKI